jgi:hypothetical protein
MLSLLRPHETCGDRALLSPSVKSPKGDLRSENQARYPVGKV